MAGYMRPETVEQTVAALAADPGWKIIAGGTDVYPSLGEASRRARLLDITGVAGLRGISHASGHWRRGALTTWTDSVRATELPPVFDALKLAAREVGSPQIQNAGTVAGNICNASPAADGTVALMALGAEVEVTGPEGARRMALADFVTGVRRVALAPSEIVTAVLIPDHGPRAVSKFLKLGARKYLVISIAMVAVVIDPDETGHVGAASVAVGSCSPVALRLTALEQRLKGTRPADMAGMVQAGDAAALSPISDVRAHAGYRAGAVPVLIRRALRDCAEALA